MTTPQDVLSYWLDELSPSDWYNQDDTVDATIRDRFGDLWEEAAEGGLGFWLTYPTETLAYIILTDQFPRNMFRGQAKAFSTDHLGLAAAKMAVGRDWDQRIDGTARQFFFLPLMHSEVLSDQDRAVRLFHTRMDDGGESNLLHARAHREIIRRFGRFPYRNEALSRTMTPAERDFLENGGYGAVLEDLKAAA